MRWKLPEEISCIKANQRRNRALFFHRRRGCTCLPEELSCIPIHFRDWMGMLKLSSGRQVHPSNLPRTDFQVTEEVVIKLSQIK